MLLLQKDVWSLCRQYLSFTDLWSKTRLLNLAHYQDVKKSKLSNKIANMITSKDLNFDEFHKVLVSSNAIISGSCLLSLVDDSIKYEDIDIFIQVDEKSESFNNNIDTFLKVVVANSMRTNQDNVLLQNAFQVGDYNSCKNDRHNINKNKVGVRDYKICNFVFQLIGVNCNPKENIHNIDFSILKNYYDGTQLVYENMTNICNKTITDSSIINKHFSIYNTLYRILKYLNKGFVFTHDIKNFIPVNTNNNEIQYYLSASSIMSKIFVNINRLCEITNNQDIIIKIPEIIANIFNYNYQTLTVSNDNVSLLIDIVFQLNSYFKEKFNNFNKNML